jgi:hypothetical protein
LRIFKNKWFNRFARREKISDALLLKAIEEAEAGIVSADLGGSIIKQRIARPGQGKSGGYRTIIIFRSRDKAFFVYGFAKSDQDNMSKDELAAFKEFAKIILEFSDGKLKKAIETGNFIEVQE